MNRVEQREKQNPPKRDYYRSRAKENPPPKADVGTGHCFTCFSRHTAHFNVRAGPLARSRLAKGRSLFRSAHRSLQQKCRAIRRSMQHCGGIAAKSGIEVNLSWDQA